MGAFWIPIRGIEIVATTPLGADVAEELGVGTTIAWLSALAAGEGVADATSVGLDGPCSAPQPKMARTMTQSPAATSHGLLLTT